jgi:type II secretory pathway component PulJ
MAKTDPQTREQQLQDAEELLLAKYADGRTWLDPVRVMHAVRAAADGYGLPDGQEPPHVPASDVLAALTQLDEARAALDTLERDLTRAARSRGASWQQVADALGLASRTSAESRAVRLERNSTSGRSDRYPQEVRAERARDRAGDAWCRANEARLRSAVFDLSTFNGTWPALSDATADEVLLSWVGGLDGPALAVRLRGLRTVLADGIPDGAKASHPSGAHGVRQEALALLDELRDARHGLTVPRTETAADHTG